jgi:hypothetical protein
MWWDDISVKSGPSIKRGVFFQSFLHKIIAIIGRRRRNRHPGRWNFKMGNENSTPVDEATPPTTLYARNLDAVARYVKERDVKNVVVMVG